jgi:hypothetical protein
MYRRWSATHHPQAFAVAHALIGIEKSFFEANKTVSTVVL